MKLATLNLWNDKETWSIRKDLIIEEIMNLKADIIALQEVPDQLELLSILEGTGISYYSFKEYMDDTEGLAVLSKFPLESVSVQNELFNRCAMRVTVNIDGLIIGITNVHLTWKSAAEREKEILEVINVISEDTHTDYEILCGDFNSKPNVSSIYNYLTGEISINSSDTSWVDLGQSLNTPTLDFRNNKWLYDRDNLNKIRNPVRYDWILLRSCYPKKEPEISSHGLFANRTMGLNKMFPSDHYGFFIDLCFLNE
ncbi:endonuclease/exonuclease/phosphatase family protein [Rossellomorea vietnamensis]|uniref:endonuclease/exonuclease/phosphatase family protein n=1 Tax=Rossellomorea vietnamensis TaxID=218284 RepID=UPI003CF30B56